MVVITLCTANQSWRLSLFSQPNEALLHYFFPLLFCDVLVWQWIRPFARASPEAGLIPSYCDVSGFRMFQFACSQVSYTMSDIAPQALILKHESRELAQEVSVVISTVHIPLDHFRYSFEQTIAQRGKSLKWRLTVRCEGFLEPYSRNTIHTH